MAYTNIRVEDWLGALQAQKPSLPCRVSWAKTGMYDR